MAVGAATAGNDAPVPDWIELIPAGARVDGRDGRTFTSSDLTALVANTQSYNAGRDLVVDFEHATDRAAPAGQMAPAAGWINELAVRAGSIWGKVAWTAKARAMIAAREYRYISPVFMSTKGDGPDGTGGEIVVILRAGLTNDPNLSLAALNSAAQVPPTETTKGASMNIAAIIAALGLSANASEAEVLTAINAAKTAGTTNVSTPDLTQFVPRAQHDALVTELNTVKAKEADAVKAAFEVAVNTALDGAVTAGKVVPAAREQYKVMCSTQDGLDNFKALVEKLPVVVSAEATAAAAKVGDAAIGTLGAEEIAVCTAMGLTAEQFLAQKKKEAA
jgi:phage I-like protein